MKKWVIAIVLIVAIIALFIFNYQSSELTQGDSSEDLSEEIKYSKEIDKKMKNSILLFNRLDPKGYDFILTQILITLAKENNETSKKVQAD